MKTLFVLLGPTSVGKTALSMDIARHIGSPILSADSRQIYKEIPVGTATPTTEQLAQIRHYFIATHSLQDYYSASIFEEEAIALIQKLHETHDNLLLCGGSMLYTDAVCKGIDDMPTVKDGIRQSVWEQFEKQGLDSLLQELEIADPQHYREVDKQNYRRVIHAVEICRQTGKPYSAFRTKSVKKRPFRIVKMGLVRERADLFDRINQRVDSMINNGLIDEARSVYSLRRLNSLNTVGFKELFLYFDGIYTLDEAMEKIKRNTRVYARKQMTWYRRDTEIAWFHPDNKEDILHFMDEKIHGK
ncbi:MAG: tRNA (adenosine(37)-N6)-dimethylallyltransferase MiaA [Tannerella sp.]|jgi:tRNA dimethylallyltransferase|nr:tRNA (adenosine(37)-N6)-dimethylallyltransferase MiaA [Tannerella sp.]